MDLGKECAVWGSKWRYYDLEGGEIMPFGGKIILTQDPLLSLPICRIDIYYGPCLGWIQ